MRILHAAVSFSAIDQSAAPASNELSEETTAQNLSNHHRAHEEVLHCLETLSRGPEDWMPEIATAAPKLKVTFPYTLGATYNAAVGLCLVSPWGKTTGGL